eukprot:gene67833-92933_t
MRYEVLTQAEAGAISACPARPGFWRLQAFDVLRDGPMTGTTRSSNGLDDRRKRLLFRCWHRGTREMDLILGRFADAEIGILADLELKQLEDLIGLEDPELYPAFVGDTQLDEQYRTPLFGRI